MSVSVSQIHSLFGISSFWEKNENTDLNDYSAGGYPSKLHIEPSTKCNLNCKHCGKRYISQPGQDGIMSLEMIDSIAKDFFDKITGLRIGGSSYGEPMVSEHFEYFLKKLKGYAIKVELVTNATLIREDNAALIADTVSNIFISVEGFGDNYEIIRGQKWDKLEKAINLLVDKRKEAGKTKPLIISFGITVKRELKNDCFKLVRFAKEHKMDLLSVRNFFPGPGEYPSSLLYFEKEHNKFYDELEQYSNSLGMPILRPPAIPRERSERKIFARSQCAQPFEAFGILPNGKIITCCLGPIDLGYYSPGERAVRGKWESADFIQLRKAVNSGNPLPVCAKCEVYNDNPLAYKQPLKRAQKLYCYFEKYTPFLAKYVRNRDT